MTVYVIITGADYEESSIRDIFYSLEKCMEDAKQYIQKEMIKSDSELEWRNNYGAYVLIEKHEIK